MQELKVIGVENGALLVASDEGARFRVEVDDALQSRLRQSIPDRGTSRRVAPRDIQMHIRSGMSAEDVAAVTGASIDYIRKFEGPVLAEREYVIESALNVPVTMAIETDPLAEGASFGSVIRRRLAESGAFSERWASWKEPGTGWIVKLTFTADEIEHDARWSFDPKRQALSPLNAEAISLSQQGELPAVLLPRLRAVPIDDTDSGHHDGRFDSGAFRVDDGDDGGPVLEPVDFFRSEPERTDSKDSESRNPEKNPESKNPDEPPRKPGSHHTADLLDALRRRRGEREPLDLEDDGDLAAHPSTGTVRLIDIPLDTVTELPIPASAPAIVPAPVSNSTGPVGSKGRKGRAAMPSWDEIVFGARSDDDL
jgi:hypothetical protein